jgi:hypothetical protein
MNVKRFWLACLAAYVVLQILGFLIHQLWLGSTYMALSEVWRPQAEMMSKMWVMYITAAVWTICFCYIFVRGYENKGIMEGLRYGVIIGLFYSLVQSYDSYVIYPIPYSLALQWFLSGLVVSIILGVIVALIYKPAEATG